MQSDRRAEYPGIPEKGRRVEVGFLNIFTDKVYMIKQDKVEKFSASGSKTCGILLKNPEQLGRKSGSRRHERSPRNIEGWERCKERGYEELTKG